MGIASELTAASAHRAMIRCGWGVIKLAGPLVTLTLLVGLVSQLAQVGFSFSAERLKLHFERLNPASNFGHLFSLRGLMELIKSVVIFLIIAYIAVSVVKDEFGSLSMLPLMPVNHILLRFGALVYRICLRVSIFLIVLAVADYLFQRFQHEKNLKMTKQEVREDQKDVEGDPKIKGRIRKMQVNLMRRRMMAAVPKADVVITNPTEYAVALAYDADEMAAPQVVAKGKDYLARKIRDIARANDVPIVENPPVARALYKAVEVGQQIPLSLYQAVAEILAFVYKAKMNRL